MSEFIKENVIFILSVIAVTGLIGGIQALPTQGPAVVMPISATTPQAGGALEVAQGTSSVSKQADTQVQPLRGGRPIGESERFDD